MKDGAHTHSDGGGSPLGLLALGVGAALVISAVMPFLLTLIHALLVIVLVCLGLVGAAVAAAVVCLVRRPAVARQVWQRINRPPVVYQPIPREMWQQRRQAIGQPQQLHVHFHGTDPAEVAEIIRRQQDGQPGA
jgi:hypothetical protein